MREFTKDAPKIKVVTVRAVIAPLPGDQEIRTSVPSNSVLEDVLPALLAGSEPIGVVDEQGRLIGQVDREAVSTLVGG